MADSAQSKENNKQTPLVHAVGVERCEFKLVL